MPLAKFTKGRKAGISDTIAYDLREGKHIKKAEDKPTIAIQNGLDFCNSYEEIAKSFDETFRINQGNSKVKKKYERLAISFSFSESVLLSEQNQIKICQEILEDYIKRQGQVLDNFQYIGIRHTDKKHHIHYHVTINRKGYDTKTLKDSLSKMKIAESCFHVESKYGLEKFENRKVNPATGRYGFSMKKEMRTLEDRRSLWKDKSKKIQTYKTYLGENIEKALEDSVSIDELKANLSNKDIDVIYKEYDTEHGKRYSASFASKDFKIAGSKLGFKGKLIHEKLEDNHATLKEWVNNRKHELINKMKVQAETKYKNIKNIHDIHLSLWIDFDFEILKVRMASERIETEKDSFINSLNQIIINYLKNILQKEAEKEKQREINKTKTIEKWKGYLTRRIRTEHNPDVLNHQFPKIILDEFVEEIDKNIENVDLLNYIDSTHLELIKQRNIYLIEEQLKADAEKHKNLILSAFEIEIKKLEDNIDNQLNAVKAKIKTDLKRRFNIHEQVIDKVYELYNIQIKELLSDQKRKVTFNKHAVDFRKQFFKRIENNPYLSDYYDDTKQAEKFVNECITKISQRMEISHPYAMELFDLQHERILRKLRESIEEEYLYNQRRSRGRRR